MKTARAFWPLNSGLLPRFSAGCEPSMLLRQRLHPNHWRRDGRNRSAARNLPFLKPGLFSPSFGATGRTCVKRRIRFGTGMVCHSCRIGGRVVPVQELRLGALLACAVRMYNAQALRASHRLSEPLGHRCGAQSLGR
jgi:hypothetical protein